jgi:hypothetical protein
VIDEPDHAGSVLCRLLVGHPEVIRIRLLGQTDLPDGAISYSLGLTLPGGRELYVDVEDAATVTPTDVPSPRDAPA